MQDEEAIMRKREDREKTREEILSVSRFSSTMIKAIETKDDTRLATNDRRLSFLQTVFLRFPHTRESLAGNESGFNWREHFLFRLSSSSVCHSLAAANPWSPFHILSPFFLLPLVLSFSQMCITMLLIGWRGEEEESAG